jgi:hypothetical protein
MVLSEVRSADERPCWNAAPVRRAAAAYDPVAAAEDDDDSKQKQPVIMPIKLRCLHLLPLLFLFALQLLLLQHSMLGTVILELVRFLLRLLLCFDGVVWATLTLLPLLLPIKY